MNSQSNELNKRISELNDETLLKIVEMDYANYRQDALDCAKEELTSRGIAYGKPIEEEQPIEAEEEENVFHPELVTVATYLNLTKAQLSKGLLEANGIPAFVADEYLVGINWLYSNAIGGVRLQVTETDAEQAKTLLEWQGDFNEEVDESVDEVYSSGYEKEPDQSSGKVFLKIAAFFGFIILAFVAMDIVNPNSIGRNFPGNFTRDVNRANHLVTLEPPSTVLAQCQTVEPTYLTFEILETVTGNDIGRNTIKIAKNQGGQIYSRHQKDVQPMSPGDKAIFFFYAKDMPGDHVMTPIRFLAVSSDSSKKKNMGERVQPLIGLPLFSADTGNPYSNAPSLIPVKDFIFSLKQPELFALKRILSENGIHLIPLPGSSVRKVAHKIPKSS